MLRVLLQNPRSWTLSEIARELERESSGNAIVAGIETGITDSASSGASRSFVVSLGTISKALRTLEDQLWVRRRGQQILVPEPRRLLLAWGAKYSERYRPRLRNSLTYPNPFGSSPLALSPSGPDLTAIGNGLESLGIFQFAFTGAAAANVRAPFIDLDTIDVYLSLPDQAEKLKGLAELAKSKADGPPSRFQLRFIDPYDLGVFMYARRSDSIPVVCDIQAFLDLNARGGRDEKQADYLFEKVIEPMWKAA